MSYETGLAFRLARRELRSGLAGFRVLVASIMLGVAAITSIGMLTSALRHGLGEQGRLLLGGDLSFALAQRRADAAERALLQEFGRTSEIASLRSLARLADNSRTALVDVKAVDAAYPLVGEVVLRGDDRLGDLLFRGMDAVVDPILMERLGLKVGDSFRLGKADVRVAGALALEPDRLSGQLNFGPRVLVSHATLEATGLVQPGSLIRWTINVLLRDASTQRDIAVVEAAVRKRFPQAGFGVRDRTSPSPSVSRAIDRFSQFLTLIGLAALFIGGVGVANAVTSHIARRRQVIATFKSLGASSRLVVLVYLAQVLLLTAGGIVAGLVIGTLLPPVVYLLLAPQLPISLSFGMPLGEMLLAALYGLLVALVFTLWPLDAARRIRAAELYRSEVASASPRPTRAMLAVMGVLLVLLVVVIVATSPMKRLSLYATLAFLGLYAGFRLLAALVRHGAQLLPRSRRPELSLARAALASPSPLVRTVVQSLGIGLSLLMAVLLVEASLTAELATGLPAEAPSFFVLDVDKRDAEGFRHIAEAASPGIRVEMAPMLRGRLVELAGRPVEQVKPAPDVEWVLRGDRGLTFADELPSGSKLVAGAWWPKDYDGPPLVSFEEGAARGLGLRLGDKLTVNVLGRDIEATIANLRQVRWESLSLNFVMLFSPNTLRDAPYKLLATLTLKRGDGVDVEGRLVSRIAAAFPAVTPIAVREALAAVDGVIQRIVTAIELASLVVLLAGALALAGAFAASHQQRLGEAVIFKVLGATRRRILAAHALEYLALAAISAIVAAGFGSLAAWAVVVGLMKLEFAFSWPAIGEVLLVVLLLVLPLGLYRTWRILGHNSSAELRRVI